MPYFALTPELTDDYDERTGLTSIRMFFSILGSLLAFTLPLWVVNGFRPEHSGNVLLMGAIFGLASALPLFLVFLGTRERPEFMNKEPTVGMKDSIKMTWQNRPFVFGLIMFLFNGVTMSIIQVILLYYVKYVVLREAQSDMIMATIFVVAIIALPLWEWISRRLNKRWAYISGIAFLAVVLLILVLADARDRHCLYHDVVCAGRDRRFGHARHALGHHPGCHRIWRMEDRRTTGRYVLQSDHAGSKSCIVHCCAGRIVGPAGQRICPQQRHTTRQRHLWHSHDRGTYPGLHALYGHPVHPAFPAWA